MEDQTNVLEQQRAYQADFQRTRRASKAAKTAETAGKTAQTAGTAMEVTGTGMQVAGKGVQLAGKGVQAAGTGISAAGNALSATGVGAVVGVPLSIVGGGAKVGGKGVEIGGKGLETAGKGVKKGGTAMKRTGNRLAAASRNAQARQAGAGGDQQGRPRMLPRLPQQNLTPGGSLRAKQQAQRNQQGFNPLNKAKQALDTGMEAVAKKTKLIGIGFVRMMWSFLWPSFGHTIWLINLTFIVSFASRIVFKKQYLPEVGEEWLPPVPVGGGAAGALKKSTLYIFKIADFFAIFLITLLVGLVDMLFLIIITLFAYIIVEGGGALAGSF